MRALTSGRLPQIGVHPISLVDAISEYAIVLLEVALAIADILPDILGKIYG